MKEKPDGKKKRSSALQELETLRAQLHAMSGDRAAKVEALRLLNARFDSLEADRSARLKLVSELGTRLEASEQDRAARLELVQELQRKLDQSEADRAARLELVRDLGTRLEASEQDRAARLEVIHAQRRQIGEQSQMLLRLEKEVTTVLRHLPLVSVVTAVFNGRRWIEHCIRSVAGQSYPRIEHIIVDGGSTDGTLDICARYPNLVVHSALDRGQSHALNKGFSMARGEILAWLCCDDEYEPDAVAQAVRALCQGHGVVMGRSRFIDAQGAVIMEHPANRQTHYDHDMLIRFWDYTPISQPATFWRHDIWESCGPLRETLHFAMDYDLWLRMSQREDFVAVSARFARYRIHPEAKCFSDNYGSRIELLRVSRQYWPAAWHPRAWRYFFGYLFSRSDITRHFADGVRLLNRATELLNEGRPVRAAAAFTAAHLRHPATPWIPGYRAALKRVLAEGLAPGWVWYLARRSAAWGLGRKRVRLFWVMSVQGEGGTTVLRAEARGYRNPYFRFWGRQGEELVLLRDWSPEPDLAQGLAERCYSEYGVHVRAGGKGDFAAQAWNAEPPPGEKKTPAREEAP